MWLMSITVWTRNPHICKIRDLPVSRLRFSAVNSAEPVRSIRTLDDPGNGARDCELLVRYTHNEFFRYRPQTSIIYD